MPTDSAMAVQRREDQPVKLTVEGGAIVSCAAANENFSRTRLLSGRPRIDRVAAEQIEYAELIVRTEGNEMILTAAHPRSVNATITVQVP
jgi:hypothetical protein